MLFVFDLAKRETENGRKEQENHAKVGISIPTADGQLTASAALPADMRGALACLAPAAARDVAAAQRSSAGGLVARGGPA